MTLGDKMLCTPHANATMRYILILACFTCQMPPGTWASNEYGSQRHEDAGGNGDTHCCLILATTGFHFHAKPPLLSDYSIGMPLGGTPGP